jgi:lysophospholipase L1-like esterase
VRRLLRGGAILGLALVLAESLLRLAALLAPALGRREAEPVPPGAVTILLVGDSHAAGAGAAPDERLPAHLERMLAARHPGMTFRVVNRGVSGANSAWVANRLERNIATYEPTLIIVWVGLNDIWNLTETEAWPGGGFGVAVRRALLHSRLYRLVTVVWHTGALEADSGSTQMRQAGMRPGSVAPEDVRRGLRFDLERMARTAFARRIPVIIMQYPLPYAVVNRTITSTAVRLGVPLMQTTLDVRRASADGHDQAALFKFVAGPHPTGLLCRYIAESTLPEVEKALHGRERESQGR